MTLRLPAARTTAVLAAMALATVAWMFSAPPEAASALAPTQTAWWNVGNQSGAPALPTPPDVDTSKHDLYVQGGGGNGLPSQTAQGNAQGGAQALAAIHYEVPDGAAVQKLTLTLTGNKPPSPPTVVVCPITVPAFRSEDNGPVTDIPKYDCTDQVAGKLNSAGALEFTDIGRLVKGPDLLLMLVPGQLDRVVLAHPDASALEVSAGYSQPPPVTQVPADSGPAFAAAPDAGNPTTASASAGNFSAPAFVNTPIGEPPLPAPLPTKAPAASQGRRLPQVAQPASAASRLPLTAQQTRLAVGAATIAAIAAFAAMVLLGPRMNVPAPGAPATAGGAVRGIGRFARPRTGITPRIW